MTPLSNLNNKTLSLERDIPSTTPLSSSYNNKRESSVESHTHIPSTTTLSSSFNNISVSPVESYTHIPTTLSSTKNRKTSTSFDGHFGNILDTIGELRSIANHARMEQQNSDGPPVKSSLRSRRIQTENSKESSFSDSFEIEENSIDPSKTKGKLNRNAMFINNNNKNN